MLAQTSDSIRGHTAYTLTAWDLSSGVRGGKATAGSVKVRLFVCQTSLIDPRASRYQKTNNVDCFDLEFWTNRLAATDPPLDISHTRIPEIPDQTEFLDKWNEFHQGYRIAKRPDGTETRIAVIGEPFKEVSPGFLPRTLAQLRAGVVNDARRLENRLRRRRLSAAEEQVQEPQQDMEEMFDALINEAEAEPEQEIQQQHAEEAPNAEPAPIPPIAELPGSEPPPPLRPLTRGEAQLQRARERFARVFGSREDVQQEDYVSPLTTMYGRAYDRYRQAEQRRADGTTTAPSLDGLSAQERRDIEEQLLWGVMRESQAMSESLEQEGDVWSYAPANPNLAQYLSSRQAQAEASSSSSRNTSRATTGGLSEVRTSIQQINSELRRLRLASEALSTIRANATPQAPLMSLDNQPDRPEPKTDAEMTKTLSCQVCYQQLADIAVLPCGHMVMCQWCADVVIPVRHSHIPTRPSKCPMCRKQVKQRFKIHMGS